MGFLRSLLSRRRFMRDSAAGVSAALLMPTLTPATAHAELPSDLTSLSAAQLSAAVRARQVSCVETMQAFLERIDNCNPVYNAVVSRLDDDTCLAEARRADEELSRGEYRGWLHGVPHAVKDLANAEGLPTSLGSPIFAGTMPESDDLHIARIRDAGAIFIGKTNVPEFGMGSQSYNSVFGVTRNAYDPALAAGGSSGGAAVGIATRMLPIADGSDMMGSLRNPAAFNNVIGFRPSQGRVPRTPDDLFYNQLSTNGPMGMNVEDTIRLLDTMAGFDPRAPMMMRDDLPGFDAYRVRGLDGLRIGWMGDYDGYLATEPGVLDLCEESLSILETHGARVDRVVPDYDMDRLWQCWLTLRHSGLSKSPGPVGSGEAERWVRRGCVAVAEGSPVGPGRWGGVERVCSGVWVGAWALSRRGAHGDAAARPGGAPSGVRGVPGQGGAGVRMASSASCGRAA